MKIKTCIIQNEIYFFSAWILFSFSLIWSNTIWVSLDKSGVLSFVLKMSRYLAYIFCCIEIIHKKVSRRLLYACIMLMTIALGSCLGSSNKTYLLYSLVLLAAIKIDDKKIVKLNCLMQGMILFTCVIFSLIFKSLDFIFDFSGRIRHGLGFTWTTSGPIIYFYFILEYVYLRYEKIKFIEYVILEILNIWFFIMTDSKMTFIVSSVCLLFFMTTSLKKKWWAFIEKRKIWLICLPILICLISIYLHYGYSSKYAIWTWMNRLLSGRLALGRSAISMYGISWFGTQIKWVGYSVLQPTVELAVGYNYVDCSYLQILLEYGILFLLVVIVIYTIALYKAIKKGNYCLAMILAFVLFFGITEPRLMNFAYNPFPLLAFTK